MVKEAIKILLSKDFWVGFKNYYSRENIAKKLDELVTNLKKQNG